MAGQPVRRREQPRQRYVHTYGHRNVQGLAQRRRRLAVVASSTAPTATTRSTARPGGDYGWNPVPGYDERVPMTDQSLPGQQTEASWSSGDPTIATSGRRLGATARSGARYDGTLAVAALKGERVLFLRFDATGDLQRIDAHPQPCGATAGSAR